MKCKRCGYQNVGKHSICENCKTPISVDEDIVTVPYKKGQHIDIEDITEEKVQPSFNQTKKRVSIFLFFLFLLITVGSLFSIRLFLLNGFSQKVLEEYEDIMEHSALALIYLGYDQEIDKMCSEYAKNYDFDYLNIEANKISLFRKKKIRKELNIYNLTSTLVVVQDGIPIAYYSKLSSSLEALEFLQQNDLVPKIIGDTSTSLEIFDKLIASPEHALIYLPTSYSDDTDDNSIALKEICEENGLLYGEVKGYMLSLKQLKSIMFKIGFSEVQRDLIIYIKHGNIVDVVDIATISRNDYFHLLSKRGIIDVNSSDLLIEISQSTFLSIVKDKELNVVFLRTENCTYCDRIKPILETIAFFNMLDIYTLDVTDNREEVSELIEELGYEEGLTATPFVLIVENNKYVDSIIGLADEELYIAKFMEYGIIK